MIKNHFEFEINTDYVTINDVCFIRGLAEDRAFLTLEFEFLYYSRVSVDCRSIVGRTES